MSLSHLLGYQRPLKPSSACPNDLLIAAQARCLGLTLVTENEREFRRVRELRVENWQV